MSTIIKTDRPAYFVMNSEGLILAEWTPSPTALVAAQTYCAAHSGELVLCETDGTAFRPIETWPVMF